MKRILAVICVFSVLPLLAEDTPGPSWWQGWKSNLRATWESDDHAVIVPLNIYHVRSTYTRERIERYNEMPWGLGFERYHTNSSRNRHSFYVLAFSDSYARVQSNVGYAWEKSCFLDNAGDMRIGLGFNATVAFRYRQDYLPFPGVIPMISLNYKCLSLQTTWVPYIGPSNGNVFLTMFKVAI